MGILDSLPDRPLTIPEADRIVEADSGVAPLTILGTDRGPQKVYTLAVVNEAVEKAYVVGYAESEGGWVKIKEWDNEEWSVEEQEETVQNWIGEEYEEIDQGLVNVDEL